MQHYGAPTRLLDWTYSFFVAVYFAFESVQSGDSCAVWALDHNWARDTARRQFPIDVQSLIEKDDFAERDKTMKGILQHEPPLPTVYPVNPFRLNQRLVLQQGVFLAPCDIAKPFMRNLEALNTAGDAADHFVKLEICVNESFLKEALKELHRMNLNRATLFPGLDGFAKHLEMLITNEKTIAWHQSNEFD